MSGTSGAESWASEPIRAFASIGTGAKDTKDRVSMGKYPFFVRSQTVEQINTWSFDGEAVLTAGDGVGTGKVFHYINGKFDYHQRVYRISNFRPDVSGRFFFHQFSRNFLARIESLTAKSSVDSVRMETIAGMEISLPTRVEQDQIAGAIDDAEDLVATLERMIAKKQAIKQGMMQQLLAGKIRLPGFSGPFVPRRLVDVSTKIQDGTHFSPTLGGRDYRYITSRNIGAGGMRLDVVEKISESEHRKIYSRCDTRLGDLLLTKDGANTGNVALNPFRDEVSLLSSVAFVRCDHGLAIEAYLMNYLLTHQGQQQIRDAMAGNAITRLTLAKIRDLVVPMPKVEEQRAIAQVLADADAEIDALRARLDKARTVKVGMMQELLSGRTHLPVEEEVAA